jgi:hypothetical protein
MVAIGAEPTASVRSVGWLRQNSCRRLVYRVDNGKRLVNSESIWNMLITIGASALFIVAVNFSRYPQSCPLYPAQKTYIHARLLWLHRQLFLLLRIVTHTVDCLSFCYLDSCFFGFISYLTENTVCFNLLSPELNPICYLLALLAHDILHVSRIRVKSLTLRLLVSYIYGATILDVSRSHTTTQHGR